MAQADPEAVVYIGKRAPKASELRTDQAVNRAKRTGQEIDTSKKWAGGQNKQHSAHKNTAMLDGETEELHHDKIGLSTGKLIAQARCSKGLTQKDLATKVNEKPHVINDYEAGKAIPNQQILNKLERVLGVKLRGKEKGAQIVPKQPAKK